MNLFLARQFNKNLCLKILRKLLNVTQSGNRRYTIPRTERLTNGCFYQVRLCNLIDTPRV